MVVRIRRWLLFTQTHPYFHVDYAEHMTAVVFLCLAPLFQWSLVKKHREFFGRRKKLTVSLFACGAHTFLLHRQKHTAKKIKCTSNARSTVFVRLRTFVGCATNNCSKDGLCAIYSQPQAVFPYARM